MRSLNVLGLEDSNVQDLEEGTPCVRKAPEDGAAPWLDLVFRSSDGFV